MAKTRAFLLSRLPGSSTPKNISDEMLRVDHAGEYGAVQIYRGQKVVFKNISNEKEKKSKTKKIFKIRNL